MEIIAVNKRGHGRVLNKSHKLSVWIEASLWSPGRVHWKRHPVQRHRRRPRQKWADLRGDRNVQAGGKGGTRESGCADGWVGWVRDGSQQLGAVKERGHGGESGCHLQHAESRGLEASRS